MRVAQKFAGYSLAEADNLRKAVRQEDPRDDGQASARSSSPAARPPGYGRDARHAAVRHHRAVRRLRLQQEPRVRLRARRLPDRVPQGALPGRVLRLPAHEREDQPRQGRRLPRRVPRRWASRCSCPTSTVRTVRLRRRCSMPTGAPAVPGAIPFGLSAVRNVGEGLVELIVAERDAQRSVRRLLRLLRARRPDRCSTSARSSR